MPQILHHPPHIIIDNSWYFITAHTCGPDFPLKRMEAKNIWLLKLHEFSREINIRIYAYVLLDNHYHFQCFFDDSKRIAKFINKFHGATSYEINKFENRAGRRIWHNYWDRIIRDEVDFYTKFNYIHYNPVKHGYVKNPAKWKFSSYRNFIIEKGDEWLQDCWKTYPIIEFNFED